MAAVQHGLQCWFLDGKQLYVNGFGKQSVCSCYLFGLCSTWLLAIVSSAWHSASCIRLLVDLYTTTGVAAKFYLSKHAVSVCC
jgi:hypothetical protein